MGISWKEFATYEILKDELKQDDSSISKIGYSRINI